METVIVIDSCSDLPREFIEENSLSALGIICNFKGAEYEDDFGKTLTYEDFYKELRNGEIATTSQINIYRFTEEFKRHVRDGKSVIYLGFSSVLSGCVNSAYLARQAVIGEYPEADITIIDTKSAALGEGLLAYYAVEHLRKGESKEEVVKWIEENKLKLNHWFTVDDLNHLKRGGGMSGTSAIIGTLLNIKPILHVDDEGRLIPVEKVKGRKKALRTLAEKLQEGIVNPEEQCIAIGHGDCLEEAEYLRDLILKEVKVKEVMINHIGPTIGAHLGPGAITLFFMGRSR